MKTRANQNLLSICVLFSDQDCYIEQSPPRSEIIYIERDFMAKQDLIARRGFASWAFWRSAARSLSFIKKNWGLRFLNRSVDGFFPTRGGRPEPGDGVIATVNKLHRGWGESLAGISIVLRNSIYFLRASSWWSNSLEQVMTRLDLDLFTKTLLSLVLTALIFFSFVVDLECRHNKTWGRRRRLPPQKPRIYSQRFRLFSWFSQARCSQLSWIFIFCMRSQCESSRPFQLWFPNCVCAQDTLISCSLLSL